MCAFLILFVCLTAGFLQILFLHCWGGLLYHGCGWVLSALPYASSLSWRSVSYIFLFVRTFACCSFLGLNSTQQLYLLNRCAQWNAQGHRGNLLRPKITLLCIFAMLPELPPLFHWNRTMGQNCTVALFHCYTWCMSVWFQPPHMMLQITSCLWWFFLKPKRSQI